MRRGKTGRLILLLRSPCSLSRLKYYHLYPWVCKKLALCAHGGSYQSSLVSKYQLCKSGDSRGIRSIYIISSGLCTFCILGSRSLSAFLVPDRTIFQMKVSLLYWEPGCRSSGPSYINLLVGASRVLLTPCRKGGSLYISRAEICNGLCVYRWHSRYHYLLMMGSLSAI